MTTDRDEMSSDIGPTEAAAVESRQRRAPYCPTPSTPTIAVRSANMTGALTSSVSDADRHHIGTVAALADTDPDESVARRSTSTPSRRIDAAAGPYSRYYPTRSTRKLAVSRRQRRRISMTTSPTA